ncbi:MAG: hypothetical protein JKY32_15420 [Rhizobiales bacterium]|nr:hypothetical protein [Hyphomicrobiales bacterium]
MAKRLAQDGITSIGHLQRMDASVLGKRYGEMGLRLARLSQGKDARTVKPDRETKSVSAETTLKIATTLWVGLFAGRRAHYV